MFRTFQDFIKHASQIYKLSFGIAENQIINKLSQVGLTSTAVVCYINWTKVDGECLSYKQIGKELGITPQAVAWHLNRLRAVWPHLFDFGPKIPPFHHRRSSRGLTMGRLRSDVEDGVEKF